MPALSNSKQDALSAIFAALSDPTRRAMLKRLSQGEATVNELAAPFKTLSSQEGVTLETNNAANSIAAQEDHKNSETTGISQTQTQNFKKT